MRKPVQRHADRNRLPGDAGPVRGNAAEVQQDEGQGGRIHDVVMRVGSVTGAGHLAGTGSLWAVDACRPLSSGHDAWLMDRENRIHRLRKPDAGQARLVESW
jgi:hypothetical protein